MIVKSLTRKSRSFRQVINYVLREEANQLFVIKHNVHGATPDEWVKSFQNNEDSRRRSRKNAVKIYHVILSWHKDDAENLTNQAMQTMTRHFMELWNPHAAWVGVGHSSPELDQDQNLNFEDKISSSGPHTHIIISGVDRFGRSIRISKAEFKKIKHQSEKRQREYLPELVHSHIDHENSSQKGISEGEYWLKQRGKQSTNKDRIKAILEKAYTIAHSSDDFFGHISNAGLEPYTRGGKIVGIRYGEKKMKMRFRLFGYTQERIKQLDEPTRQKAYPSLER